MAIDIDSILSSYRNQIDGILGKTSFLDKIIQRGNIDEALASGIPMGGAAVPRFGGMGTTSGQPVGANEALQDLMTFVGSIGDKSPDWATIYGNRAARQLDEQKLMDAREIAEAEAVNQAVQQNKNIGADLAGARTEAILAEGTQDLQSREINQSLMDSLMDADVAREGNRQKAYELLSKSEKEMYDMIANAVGTKEQQSALTDRVAEIIRERGHDKETVTGYTPRQKSDLIQEGIRTLKWGGGGMEPVDKALSGVKDAFPLDAPPAGKQPLVGFDPKVKTVEGIRFGGYEGPAGEWIPEATYKEDKPLSDIISEAEEKEKIKTEGYKERNIFASEQKVDTAGDIERAKVEAKIGTENIGRAQESVPKIDSIVDDLNTIEKLLRNGLTTGVISGSTLVTTLKRIVGFTDIETFVSTAERLSLGNLKERMGAANISVVDVIRNAMAEGIGATNSVDTNLKRIQVLRDHLLKSRRRNITIIGDKGIGEYKPQAILKIQTRSRPMGSSVKLEDGRTGVIVGQDQVRIDE